MRLNKSELMVYMMLFLNLLRAYCAIENIKKSRMKTFTKTKFKILDDQTNIDKYRLAANITEYHIIQISPLTIGLL